MRYKIRPWSFLSILLTVVLVFSSISPAAAGESETEYIVKYKDSACRTEDGKAPFDVVSGSALNSLLRAGLLEWYEPDGTAFLIDPEPEGELMGVLSPYYDDAQWNLEMIGADAAYREGLLGQGVRVGVLDSGVNPHPDFGDRLLPGHNYTPDASDTEDTSDGYGHGTKTAGIIAAASESGYIGVAPAAEIVPLKVTDGKSVKISAICEAIYGAIDDYGCRVLNLSMGVRTDYASLREALDYAEEKNVVVVSAVGNNGSSGLYYPAAYDTVIGVGAVDGRGTLYYHSNYNSSVFLTAPGVEVRSTAAPGGYISSTGTSFAVPHVSGAAAVLLGMDDTLTPLDIRELLAETASDTGADGYDEAYGYGILNVAGCVAALGSISPAPEAPCSFLPEAGPAEAVRNNTDSVFDCVYLLAVYDENGVCLGVETFRLALNPGETASIASPKGGERFGQFLYNAITQSPLAAARKG